MTVGPATGVIVAAGIVLAGASDVVVVGADVGVDAGVGAVGAIVGLAAEGAVMVDVADVVGAVVVGEDPEAGMAVLDVVAVEPVLGIIIDGDKSVVAAEEGGVARGDKVADGWEAGGKVETGKEMEGDETEGVINGLSSEEVEERGAALLGSPVMACSILLAAKVSWSTAKF